MEELIFFGGLVVVAIPVLLIVFMIWTVNLSNQLRQLEVEVRRLQRQPTQPAAALAPISVPERPPEPEPQEAESVAAPAAGPWEARAEVAAPPAPPESDAPEVVQAVPPAALPPVPAVEPVPDSPPKAVVLRRETADALSDWLRTNWIYLVSAVSLAAAGIFFVQYGIEAGLLPPVARVVAAVLFGLALVIGGETVRRRWGDRDGATAYLPSVFSSAGIVTLFGAVLAALHLYHLVGSTTGFAGLVAVAALAVGLGWYSGPLLAAVGVAGAMAAPFLVGGSSPAPELFFGYFALIALVGLGIDAGRRWAWVSALSLTLAFPAGWLLYLNTGAAEAFAAYLVALSLASIAVPVLSLRPSHGGAAVIESFARGRPRGWPGFPTRLVAGTMLAASLSLLPVSLDGAAGFWVALAGLALLFLALTLWAARAEALEDLALMPGLGVVILPALQLWGPGAVFDVLIKAYFGPEGTVLPMDTYWILGIVTLLGLAAAWRSYHGARWPVAWAVGAAVLAPLTLAVFEAVWGISRLFGAYPVALVALGLAGLMTLQALIFGRRDGATQARSAGFVLSALALIALSLTLLLTETALTLSFAVLTVAAAGIDRRFGLRPVSVAVQAGAVALGWRLILDPGLGWAETAPYWELALGYGGALAALAAALRLLPRPRLITRAVAESALWTLMAVFASVLIARAIEDLTEVASAATHWGYGLLATIWLAAAAGQLWRSQAGGALRRLRLGLTLAYGVLVVGFLGLALTDGNPLSSGRAAVRVLGPVVFNTLIPAYLLPALLLGFVARRFRFLSDLQRRVIGGAGALLGLFWAALAIRHAWRGDGMWRPGFAEPELYSYTIALLVLGGGLLWQALARRSAGLRKLAMTVIALTVAKVFLVDAAGLVGLLRVFSFLALGLALAGLAFLNRWAAGHIAGQAEKAEE